MDKKNQRNFSVIFPRKSKDNKKIIIRKKENFNFEKFCDNFTSKNNCLEKSYNFYSSLVSKKKNCRNCMTGSYGDIYDTSVVQPWEITETMD